MSDLIKLHNDIMSVQKKLIDCERDMNSPFEHNERLLDARITAITDSIAQHQPLAAILPQIPRVSTTPAIATAHYLPATPSNTLSSSSFSGTPNGSRDNVNGVDTPPMSSTEINSSSSAILRSSGAAASSSPSNSLEGASMNSNSSGRVSRQHMDTIVARY